MCVNFRPDTTQLDSPAEDGVLHAKILDRRVALIVQDELKQYGFQLRNECKSTNSSAHASLVQSHEMHQVSTEDADDQPGSKRADVVWSTLTIFMRKKSDQHTAYLNYNKSNLVDNTESRGWQKHWPKRHSQPHLLLLWSNVNHGIV